MTTISVRTEVEIDSELAIEQLQQEGFACFDNEDDIVEYVQHDLDKMVFDGVADAVETLRCDYDKIVGNTFEEIVKDIEDEGYMVFESKADAVDHVRDLGYYCISHDEPLDVVAHDIGLELTNDIIAEADWLPDVIDYYNEMQIVAALKESTMLDKVLKELQSQGDVSTDLSNATTDSLISELGRRLESVAETASQPATEPLEASTDQQASKPEPCTVIRRSPMGISTWYFESEERARAFIASVSNPEGTTMEITYQTSR